SEGPLDPFLDDPDDPAAELAELAELEPVEPMSPEELKDVRDDIDAIVEFRALLEPSGIKGIVVECSDCAEPHFFSWELMTANLRALLGEGRTHVHEPAFAPDPEAYVSWDYARGYADAVSAVAERG